MYICVEILKIYAHGFLQANMIAVQEKEKEAVDRLKQRYKNEDASMIFTNLSFIMAVRSIMRSMFLV